MQCSRCSEPINPIFVCDIDGTLGDYHSHFYQFAQGYEQDSLRPFYDGSVEMHEWWGMDLEHYRTIKLAYRQGGMKRSMPKFPGARMLIDIAMDHDCEVWLTTTRPYLRLDNIDPDTRFWLERHGIKYDGLLYDENKYYRLAERVDPKRVVMVLEDLPEQFVQAADLFPGAAVLMAAQHNREARVSNWIPQPYAYVESLTQARTTLVGKVLDWKLQWP